MDRGIDPDARTATSEPILARLVRLWIGLWAPLFTPRIDGFVDRIIADEAFGWAFDRRGPHRRVLVVATFGGKVLAETLADLPRRDLEGAGKGDGRYGFRLKLPAGLAPNARSELKIEAVAPFRRQKLKHARRFREEAPAPTKPLLPEQGPAAGFLERYADGVLAGWAVDPNNPEAPARVDVFEGEAFLGLAVCQIERPRLREFGAPLGAMGFEFRLPAGRKILPDILRARISGTRIDLRRSRAFPGGGASGGERDSRSFEGGDQAAPPRAVFRRPTMSREAHASDKVSFLVCGGGEAEAFETTIQTCRDQSWSPVDCAVVSDSPVWARAGAPRLGGADDAALRAFIGRAHTVVVVAPGQKVDPDLARHVMEQDLQADVFCWESAADNRLKLDPDVALRLGARSTGLAVRSVVLAGYPLDLAARLATDGLGWAERWTATAGLNWACLDGALATPAIGARPPPAADADPRAEPCQRLSLAVWSGWGLGPPPGLTALLAGATGFDVEVLAPAAAGANLLKPLQSITASGARSLNFRLVDAPSELGEAGLWRAMSEAATGQVVILCEGSVRPPAGAVADLAAWAVRPGIGGVTMTVVAEPDLALSGLGLTEGTSVTIGFDAVPDRPVPAAPALIMAISKAALAEAGGIAATQGRSADLDLGLRLRRLGRRSILLGRHQAVAAADHLRVWLDGLAAPDVPVGLDEGDAAGSRRGKPARSG